MSIEDASPPKRKYDTTLARMAGNLAAGFISRNDNNTLEKIVEQSVRLARAILAEIERTTP